MKTLEQEAMLRHLQKHHIRELENIMADIATLTIKPTTITWNCGFWSIIITTEKAQEILNEYPLTPEQAAKRIAYEVCKDLPPSEDERIRNALITLTKVPRKEVFEAEGITKEQALAWLEKQKEQSEVDLEKTIEFECIGKKVKMTIQELINYYIDSECADVADECGF